MYTSTKPQQQHLICHQRSLRFFSKGIGDNRKVTCAKRSFYKHSFLYLKNIDVIFLFKIKRENKIDL